MNYSEAFSELRKSASEEEVALLTNTVGGLPSSYLEFLRRTDGADGALAQPEGVAVRLYSVHESLESNRGYRIQDSLPELWLIGDDSGDYGFCFDRSGSPLPDSWPIVEVPLGSLFADELFVVASSFSDWQECSFAVRHGSSVPPPAT